MTRSRLGSELKSELKYLAAVAVKGNDFSGFSVPAVSGDPQRKKTQRKKTAQAFEARLKGYVMPISKLIHSSLRGWLCVRLAAR